MAYDAAPTPPTAWTTAWTTASDLSADQRSRYGDYVAAKDQVRARVAQANQPGPTREQLGFPPGVLIGQRELTAAWFAYEMKKGGL